MPSFRGAAVAIIAVVLGLGALPMTAFAQTLMWQDVDRIAVLCLTPYTPLADNTALESDICRRVVEQAARGSALPVTGIPVGDAQIMAPGTVTLLVQTSVQPGPDARPLLVFSMRPYRSSSEQTAQLFSASPRAARLERGGVAGADVDQAISAALDETLPWRAKAPSVEGQPVHN